MNSFKTFVVAVALAGASVPAFAKPVPVPPPPPSELCTATTSVLAYTSCSGAFAGNINGNFGLEKAQIGALTGTTPGTFVFRGSSNDVDAGPSNNAVTGSVGPFTLTFDEPLSGSFVIGLKASNQHSFYFYKNAPPTTSITFDTTAGVAVNNNNIPQGLSHATLYTNPVPEPETYALMVAGLVGVGFMARRRKV